MNRILIVSLLLYSLNALGQKNTYNCMLLKNIVKGIELKKRNIELYRLVDGKYDWSTDTIKPKVEYINDRVLDSILKLYDIKVILRARFDSIFYLSDYNIIFDPSHIFTPKCNCEINDKKILVVNDSSDLLKYENFNLINVVGTLYRYNTYSIIENKRINYFAIKLRHRSAKSKLDYVICLYLNVENVLVVKEFRVVRKNEIDVDENSVR